MRSIDLNADMGEGFATDLELLSVVTSANVSCGSYLLSGLPDFEIARAADAARVRIGFHPGYPDPETFGRRSYRDLPQEIHAQIHAAFTASLRQIPVKARYLKPHGALYHDCMSDGYPRDLVLAMLSGTGLALMGLPGTEHESLAREAGVGFIREGFVDRRMRDDGTLVPRSEPSAILSDPDEIGEQAIRLAGKCDSRCLHGDGHDPIQVARIARAALESAGYEVGNGCFGEVEVVSSLGPNYWVETENEAYGYVRFGVPSGGPVGWGGTILASFCASEGCLETAGPLTLHFLHETIAYFVDGGEGILIDGEPVETSCATMISAGSIVEIAAPRAVARRSIHWHDLTSPGLIPRLIRTDDRLRCATALRPHGRKHMYNYPVPDYLTYEPVDEKAEPLLFEVHHHSSRVGIRLTPVSVAPPTLSPLMRSEPAVEHMLQQTPAGEWIIHGPDGPTITGYPRVGMLCATSTSRLGLLRPGDRLWLVPLSMYGRCNFESDTRTCDRIVDFEYLTDAQDRTMEWQDITLPPPPSRGTGVE